MTWTKWSYMDHWVTETPQGPQPPSFNRATMDRYVKQLSALGFTGFDTFFFYLHMLGGMYGSVPSFERFLQDNGFDKITGIFSAYPSATRFTAPHVRETHDRIVADCTNTLRMCEGLQAVAATGDHRDVEALRIESEGTAQHDLTRALLEPRPRLVAERRRLA